MKISIVTTTYNSAKTLDDTLNSVINQNYDDWEVLIVDGGSQDSTLDIVMNYESQYPDKIKHVSEPDEGIYDAMNKGIYMASGDIVGILNSDDYFFDTNVLSYVNDAFIKSDVDCIFGNLVYVDPVGTNKLVRIWRGSEYKEGKFKYGWVPAHPTFYVKRDAYIKYGGYDLSFKVSADFELMLRYLAKYKVRSKYINKFLVRMRAGGESNGSYKNIVVGNKNIIRAFKKNGVSRSPIYPVTRLLPKMIQQIKLKLMSVAHINPQLN